MRCAKTIAFSAAILVLTKLTLELRTITSASTIAFGFLIIVLLSAFFGDIVVAITTSIVATLCFDYFYLPPFGTFNIAAFPDWISLTAFLLASVIISRLTASAAENTAKANVLNKTMIQLKKFGEWLLSAPRDQLTLSGIAQEARNVFSLEYCSIHVYGEGKWRQFSGAAPSDVPRDIENKLKQYQDHPTDLMELADENMLGVRYTQINKDASLLAILAIKSRTLPTDAMGAIAYMIGVRLSSIMEDKKTSVAP
jgi:two-component system sensor histidine kinase KdpD